MPNQEKNSSIYRKGIILLAITLGLTIAHLLGYDIMTPIKMAGLFSLVIVILVTVHELGHFVPAIIFGMRIETFSIGFPPRIISFKKNHTTYQLGLLPLGGYVRIYGSHGDAINVKSEEKPPSYSFQAKPIWQRIIVMSGGVIMNIILGIGLFSWIVFSQGEVKTSVEKMNQGIAIYPQLPDLNRCKEKVDKTTLGHIIGLKTGDKLVQINGNHYPYLEDFFTLENLLEDDAKVEVIREKKSLTLPIPSNLTALLSSDTVHMLCASINISSEITVRPGFASEKVGLKSGDRILLLGTTPIHSYPDLFKTIPVYANSDSAVRLKYLREGQEFETQFKFDSTGKMGISPFNFINPDTLELTLGESFIAGSKKALSLAKVQTKGMTQIITGQADASKSMDGPVGIFGILWDIFDQKEGGNWLGVAALLGILSIILAYANLLPIPLLDGGQLVWLFWEGISGKAPNQQILNISSLIGFVLILGLMVTVIGMDIFKIAACP